MSNCYFQKTETNIPGNETKYECSHGHVFYISQSQINHLQAYGKDVEKWFRELKKSERDKCRASRNES